MELKSSQEEAEIRTRDFLSEFEGSTGCIHPPDESTNAWASDVYHPQNRDQQTSMSSIMAYNQ
jgi:hypothetical protein